MERQCQFCQKPFSTTRREQKFCGHKCKGDAIAVHPSQRLRYRVDENECWIWLGCVDSGGYAALSYRRRTVRGHVVSYEAAFGPIPSGLVIDHLCRVRNCVNPNHLEAVTDAVNIARGGRWRAAVVCSEIPAEARS